MEKLSKLSFEQKLYFMAMTGYAITQENMTKERIDSMDNKSIMELHDRFLKFVNDM